MGDCIFCKIAEGKLASQKVYEDGECVAVMDKFPATRGQTLIISKKHENYVFDLDDRTYSHLFDVAKKVAKAIDSSLKPVRTCLLAEGFEMAHVHLKLYPCYENKLSLAGKEENSENLEKTAKLIKKKI